MKTHPKTTQIRFCSKHQLWVISWKEEIKEKESSPSNNGVTSSRKRKELCLERRTSLILERTPDGWRRAWEKRKKEKRELRILERNESVSLGIWLPQVIERKRKWTLLTPGSNQNLNTT